MKQLSDEAPINITGYFLPWLLVGDRPQMIEMEGVRFLPIFSDMAKLHAFMQALTAERYGMKRIEDGYDFLQSVVEHKIRVCINPRREGNVTRFAEARMPTT